MTLNRFNHCRKPFLLKIFSKKATAEDSFDPSVPHSDSSLRLTHPRRQARSLSIFVATWNVGGKSPHEEIDLDDFLQINNSADLYVLGFQEIVPLNAGNVLVVEDNEPAAKWLSSINSSLNQSRGKIARKKKPLSTLGSSLPFQRPFFKKFCENFRGESGGRLKSCNCSPLRGVADGECSSDEDDDRISSVPEGAHDFKYGMVMAKQMVGIFLTIWAKKELVSAIGHLRTSCTGRGIMGCLGNKGCISVSMTIHKTSFCFVCSHLASGEKEGDELRRNTDVVEILKNTQFPRKCRSSLFRIPEKIVDHDRVLWLGDLNYRIALSYSETRKLVEENDWGTLFDNDQLNRERDAGRVFSGWKEGKICFAPTYKYSCNSDIYAGETAETRGKRRTPAWLSSSSSPSIGEEDDIKAKMLILCRCDRILWVGEGINQLSYVRLESRFSDHRPVCSTFVVDVDVVEPLWG